MQLKTPLLLVGGLLAVGLAVASQSLGSDFGSEAAAPGGAPFQEPPPKPADPATTLKVQELERKVAALEAWVAAQQAQAKATAAALGEAEAAGFTAGINPRSREVLLGAWRAAAEKAQAPLGKGASADAADGADSERPGRGKR